MNTGIIILAAGSSSRLGRPKQLLLYKGSTLLSRIVKESVLFADRAVVVVTGSYNMEVEAAIQDKNVLICNNLKWKEGMASSIRKGLKHLLVFHPELKSCIITVCDQPYIENSVFFELEALQIATEKGIIACGYAENFGVPVLFTKQYFKDLLLLEGQQGARKLLKQYKEDLAILPFENGIIDIDTIEDYEKLIHK